MVPYEEHKTFWGANHKISCKGKRSFIRHSPQTIKEIDKVNSLPNGERLVGAYLCYNCDKLHIGRGEEVK
jgi:hypothetical protein